MTEHRTTYSLPKINLLMIIVEIGIILLMIAIFTRNLQDFSTDKIIPGIETGDVVYSGAVSALIFQKTGAIPLWNPLYGNGQPTFESLYSFLLNPFTTFPFLWFGVANGMKVGVLVHIVIMGVGGWALGRVLRLNGPGRVLLGLLLAGSGDITATIGFGYYQIMASETYVPWVLAGLIATLYMRRRWGIGLLAVSGVLMIFVGTYFYLGALVISAALIFVLSIFGWDGERRKVTVNIRGISRLIWATVLTIGLAAIPLLALRNVGMIAHYEDTLRDTFDFMQLFPLYFAPNSLPTTDANEAYTYFHYIVPMAFIVGLFLVQIVITLTRSGDKSRRDAWKVIVPALVLIVFFTTLAMGKTPFVLWIRETFPITQEWQYIVRLMGAASPWIAILAAMWFSDLWDFWLKLYREKLAPRLQTIRALPVKPQTILRIGQAAILIVAYVAATDVLSNWNRSIGLVDWNSDSTDQFLGVQYLRSQYPDQMLMVQSGSLSGRQYYYQNLVRTSFSNQVVAMHGKSSTLGPQNSLTLLPQFSAGGVIGYVYQIIDQGYLPITESPEAFVGTNAAWYNPDAVPYAFWVDRKSLGPNTTTFHRGEAQPVTYFDQMNSIDLTVNDHTPGAVLIVQDIDYPGWMVTVDGQPAKVESIGELLGVVLPDKPAGAPTYVVFTYKPAGVYVGGEITVLFVLIFAIYMVRLDERIPVRLRKRIARAAASAASAGVAAGSVMGSRAMYVLTSTDLLEPKREGKPQPEQDPSRLLPPTTSSSTSSSNGDEPQKLLEAATGGTVDEDEGLGVS